MPVISKQRQQMCNLRGMSVFNVHLCSFRFHYFSLNSSLFFHTHTAQLLLLLYLSNFFAHLIWCRFLLLFSTNGTIFSLTLSHDLLNVHFPNEKVHTNCSSVFCAKLYAIVVSDSPQNSHYFFSLVLWFQRAVVQLYSSVCVCLRKCFSLYEVYAKICETICELW